MLVTNNGLDGQCFQYRIDSSCKTVTVSSYGRFKDVSAKTRIICTTAYLCLDATKSMEH